MFPETTAARRATAGMEGAASQCRHAKRATVSGDPRAGLCGGQGRSRTADTLIFSQVLYQLSYLATNTTRASVEGRIVRISPGGVNNGTGRDGPARHRTNRRAKTSHATTPTKQTIASPSDHFEA